MQKRQGHVGACYERTRVNGERNNRKGIKRGKVVAGTKGEVRRSKRKGLADEIEMAEASRTVWRLPRIKMLIGKNRG